MRLSLYINKRIFKKDLKFIGYFLVESEISKTKFLEVNALLRTAIIARYF